MSQESLSYTAIKFFGDLVLDKSLANYYELSRLPRFMSESIISKYLRLETVAVLIKLQRLIAEAYPDPVAKEFYIHKLRQEGRIRILDQFFVDSDCNCVLNIPSLRINNAIPSSRLLRKYRGLVNGLWGFGTLVAKSEHDNPILEELVPFEPPKVDVKEFGEIRGAFTLTEWIDFLVITMGLNPVRYDWSQKILLLSRLIPLVEGNVNILELGPRATGKTYTYKNLTHHTRFYSERFAQAANLIFRARRPVGWDFDFGDGDVDALVLKIDRTGQDVGLRSAVSKFKYFMANGLERKSSDGSLIFIGNIDNEMMLLDSLVSVLPEYMRDTTFFDGLCGIIPGWEIPRIGKNGYSLTNGFGLMADYFSEIMHKIRELDYRPLVSEVIELGNCSIRDETAILKMAAGICKLLFPNGTIYKDNLDLILKSLVGFRQLAVDQLNKLDPDAYPEKKITYSIRK